MQKKQHQQGEVVDSGWGGFSFEFNFSNHVSFDLPAVSIMPRWINRRVQVRKLWPHDNDEDRGGAGKKKKMKRDKTAAAAAAAADPSNFKVDTLVMANIEVKDLQKMMMIATQPSSVPRCWIMLPQYLVKRCWVFGFEVGPMTRPIGLH